MLHLESIKAHDHDKRPFNGSMKENDDGTNSTASSQWKKHPNHGNGTWNRDEKIVDFLRMVYKKLERMDARQPKNNTNGSMHELLNAMSKNFFHVDLTESRRNGSGRGRSVFEIRNQREFIRLKREFERIMRFYNKSMRWNEKQNRKESRKKSGQSHGEKNKKSKDKKKRKKNYYKGFYDFVNSYVSEKLSMLEARNATEELIKKMKIDKFTVRNGTAFTVGEMYAFFKHIIENKLNTTEEISVTETTTFLVPTSDDIDFNENGTSTTSTKDNLVLNNEIPAKEGAPKHRSKRIRNASEDTDVTRQKRKLLSLKVSSNHQTGSKIKEEEETFKDADGFNASGFTLNELEAQQQSRAKRFLKASELDNQIFLKNFYLNAYEDEYRENVKRSIESYDHTKSSRSASRRRKGNLDIYEIK